MAEEEFFYGLVATEATVAPLDVSHFIGSEPMSLALGKQMHALGIELWMVDGGIYINHLTNVQTEEASAATLISE